MMTHVVRITPNKSYITSMYKTSMLKSSFCDYSDA